MLKTILEADATAGLGAIQILCPPGAFALTPASRIAIQAIGKYQYLLCGVGIDWGAGTGCLAIAAAKIKRVARVVGLDISPLNIDAARQNAVLNGVDDRVAFFQSASYQPIAQTDRTILASLKGRTNFVLANAPSSAGDDGFGFRRLVLRGAQEYLTRDGIVFLNISYQYGQQRVTRLSQEISGVHHEGVLASTDWVPFDLKRPDLRQCLESYVAEERRGGLKYAFANPDVSDVLMDAQAAQAHFMQTGASPLTKWQTHLFRFVGG